MPGLLVSNYASMGGKQKDRDKAEGSKTKENGNCFPQHRVCPFV